MKKGSDVSNEYYDWRVTRKPERPWRHAYHQTLVDKVWIGIKANACTGTPARLVNDAEQALQRIRRIDRVTREIPKITYLIGWQHDGHDSKYPDWSVVNPRLQRAGDQTARAGLVWLMEEARKHHTTVSLHINMLDAYENSPLWAEYLARGVLLKVGNDLWRHPWAVWGGEQAYWIDFAREWESGLAQRRIDGLLEMLPIREQGTIHIDAFYPPQFTDPQPQQAAMRRIFRYWRDQGVDVTSENMGHMRMGEAFIGLQPMAWWLNYTGNIWEVQEVCEQVWMEIPASLYCGGVDKLELGTGQLFGTSMMGEGIEDVDDFRRPFCLQTLPWHYLNRHDRLRLVHEAAGTRTLELADGLLSQVRNGQRTIRHNGRLLVDGTDVCVPALWRPHRELIAFSKAGYAGREWALLPDWRGVRAADLYDVRQTGLSFLRTTEISGEKLTLALQGGQMLSVVPSGTARTALEA